MRGWLFATFLAFLAISSASFAHSEQLRKSVINPPPTVQDWTALAKLPDWSGVWNPKVTDQDAQVRTNRPPWNEKAAAEVAKIFEYRHDEPPGRKSKSATVSDSAAAG